MLKIKLWTEEFFLILFLCTLCYTLYNSMDNRYITTLIHLIGR